jgi:putative transcriptional regulator
MRMLLAFLAALIAGPAFAQPDDAMRSILLVSKKDMADPNFRETVVLITHGTSAPFGVILNRQTEIPLSTALPKGDRLKHRDGKLFFGGPVARDTVTFVFRSAKAREGAIHLAADIYFASNADLLDELLARNEPLDGLRIFAGYAGWAPGQLEAEIARGDWHLSRVDAASIFAAKPETLWGELYRKAGGTRAQTGGWLPVCYKGI